jgi:hypothetical protein
MPFSGSTGQAVTADAKRRRAAHARAARQLALDRTLAELVVAFAARDVRPLLLKGPAFARWLYDDPHERRYGDLDLLVAPEQLAVAGRVLAERGFAARPAGSHPSEHSHHVVWDRHGPVPACVELHHTLGSVPAEPSLVWQRLAAGAEEIEVAGARIAVPGLTAAAFIVAVHAARHGTADAKHVRDLRQALARVDTQAWRDAAALAQELGARDAFGAGLRLDPSGSEVAAHLGLEQHMCSRLLVLQAGSAPDSVLGIERLSAARGGSARLRLLAWTLMPSRGMMLEWYPLAHRGRAGLIAAYVCRPFRLAAKLPLGWWRWRRMVGQRTARR